MLIHWYVLKEHIWPFMLGLMTLTIVLVMNQIFLLIWDILGKGISAATVFYILLLYLPTIFALTVPMAVMVASCMSFGRLSQDMEIVALRSTGTNPLYLNTVPLITGALLTLGMIWFNNHILPETNHRLKNTMLDVAQKKPCLRIKALVTITDLEGYDMQVAKVDYKKSEMYRVKLFEKETGQEIFARSGLFYTDSAKITLVLKEGEIHEQMTSGRYRRLVFDEHHIHIPIDQEAVRRDRKYRGERELSANGLKKRVEDVREGRGSESHKKRKMNGLLVEYHKKYSIPFACFAFVILGCPLAIKVKRRGAGAGFGLALLFFIFYYICLVGGEHLGDRGVVRPWLAMWFPNFVLLLIGLWATWRANR
jgi:lipopolysaccharide export system permease protein